MSIASRKQALIELRESCESDLWTFAQIIEPHRVYGEVHKELFKWWQYEADDHSLVLLPRDHQKSHCIAVLATWLIVNDPAITILYESATSYLAQQQLRDIKNIMTSKTFRMLWPDMIEREEGQREKWTNTEICVDHQNRKDEGIRDSTVFTAGLTTNTTGLHCKVILKDDIVVPENAYTDEGRRGVASATSQLASILTTGGQEYGVGTRYHPKDHYQDLKDMQREVFNDDYEVIDQIPVYKIFEREVEESGDFLWPVQHRSYDGKPYGFDANILAIKKAKYLDTAQFFAQYYNNPNDMENARLTRDKFQYYDKKHLINAGGIWKVNGNRLNLYASIDFAYSTTAKADYTCIVVIGMDHSGDIYVLDIDRFKTKKMETYFQAVLSMCSKWELNRIRAEVTAAQDTIAEYIQDRAKQLGMSLKIDRFRPNRYQGSKEERIAAALEPRYENRSIWHFKGGFVDMLEEELVQSNPKHDDLKDCLASAVSGEIKAPRPDRTDQENVVPLRAHPRFGGVSF